MGETDSRAEAHKKSQPYRCFLVRCRLEEGACTGAGPDGEPAWRFTVQQAGRDGARRFFDCLHDVIAYIHAELASCSAFSRNDPDNTAVGHSETGPDETETPI